MAGGRRAWSNTAPLLDPQQHKHLVNLPSSVGMAASASVPRRSVFLGVDVGTGSARAGLFDGNGKLLGCASSPIQIWKEGDCVEQSSTDIWHSICAAVKSACSLANVSGEDVTGLGFAATCSLVAVDSEGSPVSVSWSNDSRRNVIVWMDHRAVKQAERINSCNSTVLQYCGGALSPEMQPPKLLWVKENLQESWSMVFRWMDLSDWLSYRATGDDTRSLCTAVCKWTYLGHAHMQQIKEKYSQDMEACGWDDDFWEEIGLGDLVDGHHAKIGTPVANSLIDAHAGGVGVMESVPVSDSESEDFNEEAICHRMVLVCGTSTCHMAVCRSKLFIPGVWGPFWSGISLFQLLNKILESMMHDLGSPFLAALTSDIHVLPDFHGNRSPIADPKAKGIVCGLTLDTSDKQLALLYLATVQGIAYGYPIILPRENEPVLLGAAILGAVAAKKYSNLNEAMKALNAAGQVIHPSEDPKVTKYHDAKYRIFRELYAQQLSHRSIMAQALA
ncbi:FGGY family of carbohydrate kinase [Actinidia rufa]|uniref:FGGY family of carbohydrate kinase n=1 Tax=Actinidia rufa TaxID=165716 RepID=A0A7J0DQ98_9ERIC|nr:FGGY family of carbohydrate kinase [Actinidia rufa]